MNRYFKLLLIVVTSLSTLHCSATRHLTQKNYDDHEYDPYDALVINYDRTELTKIYSKGRKSYKTRNERTNYTLTITPFYFKQENASVRIIHDFVKDAYIYIDKKRKRYYGVPLLSILQQKNMNMNRDPRNTALSTSDQFALESYYSMKSGGPIADQISMSYKKGFQVFKANNKQFVKIGYSNFEVPKMFHDMYERFILYTARIHPEVRYEIKKNKAFNYLSYFAKSRRVETTVTYRAKKIKTSRVNYYHIPILKSDFYYDHNPVLSEIIRKLYKDEIIHLKPSRNSAKISVFYSINRGQHFNALLAYQEYILQEGRKPDFPLPFNYNADKRIDLFYKHKDIKDVNSPIVNMSASKLKRGHVLNFFKAQHLAEIRPKKAIKLLLEALQKSPFMTEAYFLLGKLYLNLNQMNSAWICFELAKRISPDHRVFDGFIPALKKRVRESRPHFFPIVE